MAFDPNQPFTIVEEEEVGFDPTKPFSVVEPSGTSFGEEVSQLGSAFVESIGRPLENMGESFDAIGFTGVANALKDVISEPEGYVSASQRFMEPKPDESQFMGFAWQYAPRAAVEQVGQAIGAMGTRAVGAAAGGAVAGPAGAVAGGFAGPAIFGAAQVIGPVAKERAMNNGREVPNNEDLVAATLTAIGSGSLDAIGARYLPGGEKATGKFFKRVASSFVGEGLLTEAPQSVIEQVGATAGTEKGLNINVKQAVGEGLIGGTSAAGLSAVVYPLTKKEEPDPKKKIIRTPEQAEELDINAKSNEEAISLMGEPADQAQNERITKLKEIESVIANNETLMTGLEPNAPERTQLDLENKEARKEADKLKAEISKSVGLSLPITTAEQQQIELAKQIARKPAQLGAMPSPAAQTAEATYGAATGVYDVFGGITRKPVSIPKPAKLPAAPTIEEQTAERTYGGETGVFDVFAGARRKPVEVTPTIKESLPVAQEAPVATKDIFVRLVTNQEKKSEKAKSKGYYTIPDKVGYDVVFKPYGEQGAGYYYKPSKQIETAKKTSEELSKKEQSDLDWAKGTIAAAEQGVTPAIASLEQAKRIVQKLEPTPEAPAITPTPVAETPAVTPAVTVETDPARRQEIQNSIAEGEGILKSGRNIAGRKLTNPELDMVRRSVDSSRAKLGDTAPAAEVAPVEEVEFAELNNLMERRGQAQSKVNGVKFSKKDEARYNELLPKFRSRLFETITPEADPVVWKDIQGNDIKVSQKGTFYTVENGRVRTGPAFQSEGFVGDVSPQPVSAAVVESNNVLLPEGYTKQGDVYVYQAPAVSEAPAAEVAPAIEPLTDDQAETIRDVITLRKSQGREPNPEQVKRLAEYDARKAGVDVQEGDIVSNIVVGHPMLEAPQPELSNLVPIKVQNKEQLASPIQRTQKVRDAAQSYIGQYQVEQAKAKTPAQKKAFAKKFNKSELDRQRDILDYIKNDVMPELDRLEKSAPSPTPAVSETITPAAEVTPIERDMTKPEQMTPTEWKASRKKAEGNIYSGAVSEYQQKGAVNNAIKKLNPVSAASVDEYGIKLPRGYEKQGDLYVFQQPDITAKKPRFDSEWVKGIRPTVAAMLDRTDSSKVITKAAGRKLSKEQEIDVVIEWARILQEQGELALPSDFNMLEMDQAYMVEPALSNLGLLEKPVSPAAEPAGISRKRKGEAGGVLIPSREDFIQAGQNIYEAGMEFGAWAKQMIQRFGDVVREFLGDVWEAVSGFPAKLEEMAGYLPGKGERGAVTFGRGEEPKNMDAEYLAAVESGDMEMAQRTVDEAAKKAGYKLLFHGSTKGKITGQLSQDARNRGNIPGLLYLTDKRGAWWYATHGGVGQKLAKTERLKQRPDLTPTLQNFYVDKSADFSGPIDLDLWLKSVLAIRTQWDALQYLGPEWSEVQSWETGSETWVISNGVKDFQDIADAWKEVMPQRIADGDWFAGHDTDALPQDILPLFSDWEVAEHYLQTNGFKTVTYLDNELTNATNRDTYTTVVLDRSAIKSADPVTYDDAGNVIPLSQRFLPTSSDIRGEAAPKKPAEPAPKKPITDPATPDEQTQQLVQQAQEQESLVDSAVKEAGTTVFDVFNRLVNEGKTEDQVAKELGISNYDVRKYKLRADTAILNKMKQNKVKPLAFAPKNPVAEFAEKNLRKYFTKEGWLPKAVFQSWVKRNAALSREQKEAEFAIKDLYAGIREVFGISKMEMITKGLVSVPPEFVQQLNDALAGKIDINTMPEPVREPLTRMRQHIDAMSRQLVDLNVLPDELSAKISENLGVYLTRSYKIFTDKNWINKIPTEKLTAARNFLYQQQLKNDPEATIEMADRELRNMLNDWASDAEGLRKRGGKLGAKDLTVMMERAKVPKVLREVMGENTNVIFNYANTIGKISRFVSDQKFLNEVKAKGTGEFLFTEKDAPKGFNTQIAAEESRTMSPLNGLRTTPEIAKAFEEFGKGYDARENPGLRLLAWMNAVGKLNLTVGSVLTQMRNLLGQPAFFVFNGHYNWRVIRQEIDAIAKEKGISQEDAKRELVKLAAAQGLVNENAYAGELRTAFQDVGLETFDDIGPDEFTKQFVLTRMYLKGVKSAQELYQKTDEFGKIVGWLNETKRIQRMNKGMDKQTAQSIAAERTRDTYPTYSQSSEALRLFRRQPFVGPFATFFYETFRTAFHNLRYAFEDINGPTPEHKAEGIKRLAGAMTTLSMGAFGINLLSKLASGIGDDEEEDVRRMLPPWARDASLAWMPKSKDGTYNFINVSYINPYNAMTDPFIAMMSGFAKGDKPEEIAVQALGSFLSPFTSEQPVTATIGDAARNRTSTGKQIYNPQDDITTKTSKIMLHIFGKTFTPGTINRLRERIIPAIQGETVGTRAPAPEKEIAAELTGIRFETLDMKAAFSSKAWEFSRAANESERIFRDVATRRRRVDEQEQVDAYRRSEQTRYEIWNDMYRDYMAVRRAGASQGEAIRLMTDIGISKKEAIAISRGRYVPYEVSNEVLRRSKLNENKVPIKEIRVIGKEMPRVLTDIKKTP